MLFWKHIQKALFLSQTHIKHDFFRVTEGGGVEFGPNH